MELFTKYVLDTNILIDLSRRIHPPRLRTEANEIAETLIARGSIISHTEVLAELKKSPKPGDVTLTWANQHNNLFADFSVEQEKNLVQILSTHPDVLDPKKFGPDADALLIALAMEINAVVVSGDGSTGRSSKTQVKDVCDAYNVRCIDVDTFLTENGWLS